MSMSIHYFDGKYFNNIRYYSNLYLFNYNGLKTVYYYDNNF